MSIARSDWRVHVIEVVAYLVVLQDNGDGFVASLAACLEQPVLTDETCSLERITAVNEVRASDGFDDVIVDL